jgi:hypothetical protein
MLIAVNEIFSGMPEKRYVADPRNLEIVHVASLEAVGLSKQPPGS